MKRLRRFVWIAGWLITATSSLLALSVILLWVRSYFFEDVLELGWENTLYSSRGTIYAQLGTERHFADFFIAVSSTRTTNPDGNWIPSFGMAYAKDQSARWVTIKIHHV